MHALPSPRAIEEPSTAQVAERGQLLAERDALAAVRLSLGRSLPFPWHSHCPLVDPFTAFHCLWLTLSLPFTAFHWPFHCIALADALASASWALGGGPALRRGAALPIAGILGARDLSTARLFALP